MLASLTGALGAAGAAAAAAACVEVLCWVVPVVGTTTSGSVIPRISEAPRLPTSTPAVRHLTNFRTIYLFKNKSETSDI